MLGPIAIPSFKGLSFLTGRSRSTPPTQRESKRSPSVRASAPEVINEKQKQKHSTPEDDGPCTDEKIPEIVIAPVVDEPARPVPAYLPLPVATPHSPGGPVEDTARARQGASAASRSTSPGPSLSEALFRARRPATPHVPSTPPTKGTRFKTSFTGVADHVLRLDEQLQQQPTQAAQTPGDLKGENSDGPANKNGDPSIEAGTQGE